MLIEYFVFPVCFSSTSRYKRSKYVFMAGVYSSKKRSWLKNIPSKNWGLVWGIVVYISDV